MKAQRFALCPLFFDGEFLAVGAEGIKDDVFQTFAAGIIEVGEDLFAHAGFPETADVVGDAFDAFRLVRLGVEEVSDTVRHLDEVVNIHGYVFVMTR
jgi:hypothetical protein